MWQRKQTQKKNKKNRVRRERINAREISTRVAIAGNNSKLQSQLTTVERYVVNADVMTNVYTDESYEAQALQDMDLSAATSTARCPSWSDQHTPYS